MWNIRTRPLEVLIFAALVLTALGVARTRSKASEAALIHARKPAVPLRFTADTCV